MCISTLKNSAFKSHLRKCTSTDLFNLTYRVTHDLYKFPDSKLCKLII